MGITSTPELENQETGTILTLYFDDNKTDGEREDVVSHEIPGRRGDIIQKMGSGSRVIEGTIFITASMFGSGIDDFEDALNTMKQSERPLIYHEDDGSSTFNCFITALEFDKGTDKTPNLIKADITIQEYTQ